MSVSFGIMAELYIAKQYEEKGYTVIRNPGSELIPFNLDGYIPDILATKDDEKILVEVKTSKAHMNAEKLLKIGKLVQPHSNWKFLVVTVNEDDINKLKSSATELNIDNVFKSLNLIQENLKKLITPAFLIPQLWVCYISILRIWLIKEEYVIPDLTDLNILNLAYSEGIIDYEQFSQSKNFLNLRNFTAHNLAHNVNTTDVENYLAMTLFILNEYEKNCNSTK